MKTYRLPKLALANANLVTLNETLHARAQEIATDANLSPRGQTAAFSRMAAQAYGRINAMRTPLMERRARALGKLEALGGTLGRAPRATESQRQLWLTVVSEMRRDPEVRARTLDRLLDAKRVDADTQAMRRFFLEDVPTELIDLTHAHGLMRLRLLPTMPEEAEAITAAVREIDRELDHVEASLDAIAASTDRDVLQEVGVIGRRVMEWTPEERATFAQQFGMDALSAAVARETVFGMTQRHGHPDSIAPTDAHLFEATADMSDFLKNFVDPAEAAADAALNNAATT